MRWWNRRGSGGGPEASRTGRRDLAEGERHLVEFAASRRGVEAFLEPPTNVTAVTVLLVASDGEWTRRRVSDSRSGHALARKLGIPSYDATVVGYPARIREWNRRQKERDTL